MLVELRFIQRPLMVLLLPSKLPEKALPEVPTGENPLLLSQVEVPEASMFVTLSAILKLDER